MADLLDRRLVGVDGRTDSIDVWHSAARRRSRAGDDRRRPVRDDPLLLRAMGGPQAMLGWFIGAVVALADGLVWAELGAAMPRSGGGYQYLLDVRIARRRPVVQFSFPVANGRRHAAGDGVGGDRVRTTPPSFSDDDRVAVEGARDGGVRSRRP
jgi:hypothetical protein